MRRRNFLILPRKSQKSNANLFMPQKPTIYLGADHAGFELKEFLKNKLEKNYEVVDVGAEKYIKTDDYPDYAEKLAQKMKSDEKARGILVCGSGIGMSIAANRHKHVRAASCVNKKMAEYARRHNNANVLALGGRFVSKKTAWEIAGVFFKTEFEGGRHGRRVEKLRV